MWNLPVPTVVTRNNFVPFVKTLIEGTEITGRFSRNCFSLYDSQCADMLEDVMDALIRRMEQAGYSPFSTLNHYLKLHHFYVKGARNPGWRRDLDDRFRIDLSDHKSAIAMALAATGKTPAMIARGNRGRR